MTFSKIGEWAQTKGINLVGTGDFTHPLWIREAKAALEEVGEGIYKLKKTKLPYFIFSTELSCIYNQKERLRRIHLLVLAPNIEAVEKLNSKLENRGVNLLSDGRPISGLSAREMTELILEVDRDFLIIPAHVWTPHFALYGSQSGFDSLRECFGSLENQIFAIETGLSSSPAMNWRVSELDKRRIVSFGDAHSPLKLGREITVFELPKLSYKEIVKAIKGEGEAEVFSTIEFYPEEGKYHFTGHRNCNVSYSPEETKKLGIICPSCGKRLTVGVMHRVEELASREIKEKELVKTQDEFGVLWTAWQKRRPYTMLVPLLEILAQAFGVKTASQNVFLEYNKLTKTFGDELRVLLNTQIEKIAKISGPKIAEAISKVRSGEITVVPGYDGVFGQVKIWPSSKEEQDSPQKEEQMNLF